MVLAYHIILSAYGFWLPNDPRGSWSETIRVYELLRFGPATKVQTTRSVAHAPHDRAIRLAAKQALRHKPVRFTGLQARAIARGFSVAAREHAYVFYALAILPDHAHLVMRAHPRHIDVISTHLKARATRQLTLESLHPFANDPRADGTLPSPWARNHWSPFIDSGVPPQSDRLRERQPHSLRPQAPTLEQRVERHLTVSTSLDP